MSGPSGAHGRARWSRAELQDAHDHFVRVANACAASGDWTAWTELFTEDAEYLEHHFGRMHGRAEIAAWIGATMAEWPNSEMTAFPHEWCVCDEERGWWICCIQNRMADPGDGNVYQASNITVLHYAGDRRFSYEEDAYNPLNFAPMIQAWSTARKRPTG